MSHFHLKIITQEEILLEKEVESLYVTTIDGDITVLAGHTPYVSILKPAEIIIKIDGNEESFSCTGGIVEVTAEEVVVLADSAVRSDMIDEQAEHEAKERAERLMEGQLGDRENAEATIALERALLNIRIATKRKHH